MSDPLADFARTIIVLASELEAEIVGRLGDPTDLHPFMRRRFERDMKPVHEARSLLRSYNFDQWSIEDAAQTLAARHRSNSKGE